MRIAGTGIDLVEVARIAETVERHGDRFLRRVFTPSETEYCRSCGVPARHFAARFAAKEAVLKLLGTGWSRGIGWRDVEVVRGPEGEPGIHLSGGAARRAKDLGIVKLHVSISHTAGHAIAQAIGEAHDQ